MLRKDRQGTVSTVPSNRGDQFLFRAALAAEGDATSTYRSASGAKAHAKGCLSLLVDNRDQESRCATAKCTDFDENSRLTIWIC